MNQFLRIGENKYINVSEIYSFRINKELLKVRLKRIKTSENDENDENVKMYNYKRKVIDRPDIISEWANFFNIDAKSRYE